jgi:MoaA/NifB/PqqE/SkfB family radical SAM enzyme
LAQQVDRLFWLDIGGGEPFLRKDLPDIIAAFDARIVMIPTNGSLGDVIVRQLNEICRRTDAEVGVSISIDGFKETNDRLRKEGSWDAAWETFEAVRRLKNISVKINTVLSKENCTEIVEFMKEVRSRGPDFHSVILLRGKSDDGAMELPTLEELRELIPEMLEVLGEYDYGRNPLMARILRNYHRYAWKISYETLVEKRQVIPCLAGTAHMVLYADGSISTCEMLPVVGNLKMQSWSEIMRGDRFQAQLKYIKAGKCHCTHNCVLLDSVLFNPRSLLKLLFPTRHDSILLAGPVTRDRS